CSPACFFLFFSLTTPSTSPTSTLSLHDALPIFGNAFNKINHFRNTVHFVGQAFKIFFRLLEFLNHRQEVSKGGFNYIFTFPRLLDRKSTRLNSSHVSISYAVFCLKKKIEKSKRD